MTGRSTLVLLCVLALPATLARGESRLSAGAAEAEITPPLGALLIGPLVPSTGVHDPLWARALVIGDGRQRAAVVCLDLVGVDFPLADEVRSRVRQRTGIALTLLNASHTHSAPFTVPWSIQGPRWVAQEGQAWRRGLAATLSDVVARAAAQMVEVRLRVGRAPAQVGMNRRLPVAQGVVMKRNPQGPTVPWVDVLRVDRLDGRPLAVLFSHAAHPVIVHGASTLVSADYPGYAVAEIRRQMGASAVVMFAQGCGANINGEPLRGGFEAAERAGEALGQAAVKAALESKPVGGGPLLAKSASFALPLRDWPAPEDCRQALAKAEQRLAQAEAKGGDPSRCWYQRDDVLCLRDLQRQAQGGKPASLRFDVNMLAVGDEFCLVALTHEVFADYQLWIERSSPFRHTMVLGYTNGCESYIPTDKDFALGGYEAAAFPQVAAALRYRGRVALKPGSEQQIRQQVQALWSR